MEMIDKIIQIEKDAKPSSKTTTTTTSFSSNPTSLFNNPPSSSNASSLFSFGQQTTSPSGNEIRCKILFSYSNYI